MLNKIMHTRIRLRKSRLRRVFILALAIWLCCETAIAQFGSDLLEDSLDTMAQTQNTWDLIWDDLFTPAAIGQSSVYQTILTVALFFAGLATVWLVFQIVEMATANGDWRVLVKPMFVVLLVWFLLYGGNGKRPIGISEGLRNIVNGWRDAGLQMQVADVTVADALKDNLIGGAIKDELAKQANYCDSLPGKLVSLPSGTRPTGEDIVLSEDQKNLYTKLECYQALGNAAQERQAQAEARWCAIGITRGLCAGTLRWLGDFAQALNDSVINEIEKAVSGEIPNVFGPSLAIADVTAATYTLDGAKKWIIGFQNLFIHSVEGIMYLTVLTAPIAISLMPLTIRGVNPFLGWLVVFMNLGLAQVYYVALLGGMAVAIARVDVPYLYNTLFPIIQGLGAPIIAAGMAVGGGIGGFMAISRAVSGVIGAIPVVGAGAASLFPRFSRN